MTKSNTKLNSKLPTDPTLASSKKPTRTAKSRPRRVRRTDDGAVNVGIDASAEPLRTESAGRLESRSLRRKRVGIGEALRQRGFDEHTIADNFIDVTQRLKRKSDKSGGVEKLLVDVLKECSKYIEPARPSDRVADRLGSGGAPIHVHLIHSVTRPARPSHATQQQLPDQVVGAEPEAASGAALQVNSDADSHAQAD
jgi:hypothetical protein